MRESRIWRTLSRPLVAGLVVGLLGIVVVAAADPSPSTADATEQYVAVSFGGTGAGGCAVTDTGAMRCWGESWDGGLANGTGGGSFSQHAPALAPVASNVVSGADQVGGNCVLSGQTVRCWGAEGVIEDGEGSLFSDPPWGSNVPRDYGHGPSTKVVGPCSLRVDQTVRCYGWSRDGQLGNGTPSWPQTGYATPPPSSATAVTVSGLTGVIDLSATNGGFCALTDDGDDTTSVWCWGVGSEGQLGDGQGGNETFPCPSRPSGCTDRRHATSPVRVAGLDDVVSVHGECAIRSGGAVVCWGKNTGGRFDPTQDGSFNAPVFTPREIPAFATAVDIAVSQRSACAVLAAGTVRCQGSWVLGDGSQDFSNQRTVTLATFGNESTDEGVEIGRLELGYCVRTRSGTIACWGMSSRTAGIAASGFDRVLTPTYVIGFGGELPEDELAVKVDIAPGEIELGLDGSGEPVPDQVVATVTIENTSADDVPNVALDATLATTLERGSVKAIEQVGDPVPAPDELTDQVEIGTIPEGESRTVEYTFEVSDAGIYGVEALVRWADPTTSATETGFDEHTVTVDVDDGFEVVLEGAITASPAIIELTATIRNDSASEFVGLDWSDGLVDEVLFPIVDENGDPVDTDPLAILSGPIPALPSSLGAGAQVVTRWTVSVQDEGAEVFQLGASGTNARGAVRSYEELSAETSSGALDAVDLTQAATEGLVEAMRLAHEELLRQWNLSIEEVAQKTGFANETEAFRQREIDSWRQLGFSQSTSEFLAAGRVQRQTIENYFGSYIVEGEATLDRLGAESGQNLYEVWDTVTTPSKLWAFGERTVKFARDEAGYLADGYANPDTPLLHQSAYDDLVNAGTETVDSIGFAITGQLDLWQIEGAKFLDDPLGFSSEVGARHGGQAVTVGFYTATGVVEEVLTGGLGPVTRAGRMVEGGVDGLRTTRKATNATEAGTDTLASSQRRFAEAEDLVVRYQDLPRASTVNFEELERLGGFNSTDAEAILQVVADVKTKFDIDVEIVFRTAEPFSTGIDGVGKRAFTKEKAVGAMDLMLGAPPSLKGKVAVFEPKPLAAEVVDAMDADNPGFKAEYLKRLDTQQKNWKAFNEGTSRTQSIVAASEKYDGVHVFDGVAGQETYGLDYLEQLDDPVYMATRPDLADLTEKQVKALRRSPSTFAKLELDTVDGAFTLSDNVRLPDGSFTKKPVISDYDGQAVIPANGADWPIEIRSQVETFVHSEFKNKLSRYGRHGWSDTANDLPAELFFLPAEYIMSTTHPAAAGRVAKDLSRRFQVLADEFDAKADRLLRDPDGAGDIAEIARLRNKAAEFRTFTPEKIREKWPAGEKTIVFTRGRISVGSNQGTGL